jgi:hypothetical protein
MPAHLYRFQIHIEIKYRIDVHEVGRPSRNLVTRTVGDAFTRYERTGGRERAGRRRSFGPGVVAEGDASPFTHEEVLWPHQNVRPCSAKRGRRERIQPEPLVPREIEEIERRVVPAAKV